VLIPMVIGAAGMLGAGLVYEPLPALNWTIAVIVMWLGVQVTMLDVLILGRELAVTQILALIVVTISIAMVQLAPGRRPDLESTRSETTAAGVDST